jgi:hypothetical protein
MEGFLFGAVVLVVGRLFWYKQDCVSVRFLIGTTQFFAVFLLLSPRNLASSLLLLFSTAVLALFSQVELPWKHAVLERADQEGTNDEAEKESGNDGSVVSTHGAAQAARRDDICRLSFRVFTLLVGIVCLACAAVDGGLTVRQAVHDFLVVAASKTILGGSLFKIQWSLVWSRVLGMALCLGEADFAVRLALTVANVSAGAKAGNRFRHSATIGSIERLLVFIFIQYQAFNAIAFILTAKSVARFQDTVEASAEYVLIGTLCSTLAAIGIGLLISLAG